MRDASASVPRAIRAATILAVIAFGAVAYRIHDARQPPVGQDTIILLRFMVVVLGGIALAGVARVRRRIAATDDYATATRLATTAWATAHSPAVAGAVVYFLAGDAGAYFMGLLVLIVVGRVLPADMAAHHRIRLTRE
jgi:hypothetical protein